MSQPAPGTGHEVVVFSDYVCPFCYLGKASLEQYLDGADDPPSVTWQPYDLRADKRRPDGSIDGDADDGKDEEYYEQARQNVERLQEEYGVEMTMELSRDVDSWNAHKAALYVRREHDAEAFGGFHDGLFDALWQEGRDLGDPEVVADVAADAGVDPDAVREAVADDHLDGTLAERFEAAREVGVSAVPTFVYDEYAARGAVPPEQFARLVGDV